MFKYTLDNKRYHTLNYYYQKKYGCKVFKVSLNAHFSCPNIDGTKGYGGCIYCAHGSGEYYEDDTDLLTQFNEVKEMLHKKWPKAKYIGYFQANTNTYAPLSELKEKYELILKQDNVVGLNIATRPDSISDEVLDYLEELNKRTDLVIELGLQTIHDETAKLINRGSTFKHDSRKCMGSALLIAHEQGNLFLNILKPDIFQHPVPSSIPHHIWKSCDGQQV